VQVDLGLAAAGDALQQHRVEAIDRGQDGGNGVALRGVQRDTAAKRGSPGAPGAGSERRRNLAQPRRQARCDHLAQRALVVSGTELEELELVGAKRRHVRHHALEWRGCARREARWSAPPRPRRRPWCSSKRHDNERPARDLDTFGSAEIEPLIEGNIEGDVQIVTAAIPAFGSSGKACG
jgi:hypothetical protein